jgi:hypothetical protein
MAAANKSVNRTGYLFGDSTVKLLESFSVINWLLASVHSGIRRHHP